MANSRIHTLRTATLLLATIFGSVNGLNGCDDCYRIDGGVIAGVIAADVVITVIIAGTIYYFARRGAIKTSRGSSQQKPSQSQPDTESPYEVQTEDKVKELSQICRT
ncbi:TYRO protein tyrosine kinase-binding protein [Stegostoma tigrinum]|uniref:TYRO protein tyrosine kinase-binding protein n=1 Tax=Stegostoma tigrinum TaxID=3053191 RepID=UPI0028705E09|nr:TYRO protein tyrosine kinase-binding protein [Stegostoma tigrinum]